MLLNTRISLSQTDPLFSGASGLVHYATACIVVDKLFGMLDVVPDLSFHGTVFCHKISSRVKNTPAPLPSQPKSLWIGRSTPSQQRNLTTKNDEKDHADRAAASVTGDRSGCSRQRSPSESSGRSEPVLTDTWRGHSEYLHLRSVMLL